MAFYGSISALRAMKSSNSRISSLCTVGNSCDNSGTLSSLRLRNMAVTGTRVPMELHAGPTLGDPSRIAAAEEFLAMRYMSVIRAVLANMSYLMTFVSLTFVLAIVAWNSYPFQPRQLVDWGCTALLVVLGAGVIWVFAQMHRDPILSRVSDTRPNELGWDFYLRIITFGAIPVFTLSLIHI